MIQTSCGGKNGKLNDTIEVSALWSNTGDFLLILKRFTNGNTSVLRFPSFPRVSSLMSKLNHGVTYPKSECIP